MATMSNRNSLTAKLFFSGEAKHDVKPQFNSCAALQEASISVHVVVLYQKHEKVMKEKFPGKLISQRKLFKRTVILSARKGEKGEE